MRLWLGSSAIALIALGVACSGKTPPDAVSPAPEPWRKIAPAEPERHVRLIHWSSCSHGTRVDLYVTDMPEVRWDAPCGHRDHVEGDDAERPDALLQLLMASPSESWKTSCAAEGTQTPRWTVQATVDGARHERSLRADAQDPECEAWAQAAKALMDLSGVYCGDDVCRLPEICDVELL